MPFDSWDVARRELALALPRLGDRDFLILGEPGAAPVPVRYVQVLRVEGVLTAECVGAASLGGAWEMDAATIELLRSMGWQTPVEVELHYGLHTPNFELHAELASFPDLADLLITSLQVLQTQPQSLELQIPAV